MSKYNLDFISDENILKHVKETVEKYRFAIDLKDFNKNLIDPIKMTFDSRVYKENIEDRIENEVSRQIDKSNTNLIGYFHQNIFKYITNFWNVPKKGFDIINEKEKIYVEMKNKHNTMNSSSSQKTYMRMQHKINSKPNAVCFLVEVIAKNSQNIPWQISLDGESISNEKIRRISIDIFYEIVTEDKFAFKKLCEQLPIIINDAVNILDDRTSTNTVLNELREYSENTLESLYLLSFKKYQGFSNDFNVK
ncbi:MAG: Eco47II family restriction endonuclease [Candidatus Moranbacteria bacterium]|nr:Eco47II family restriction endonuclease [Candidatus Moranbacteria bacterium]